MMTPAVPHSPAPAAAGAAATAEPPHYTLRLYVAGSLPNSVQARSNLQRLCEEHLAGRCTVEIVDFLEDPARALADGVLVTPTLLRVAPEPRRMVVGALTDASVVLDALDLPR
jgi:circadian clock protein KaiB